MAELCSKPVTKGDKHLLEEHVTVINSNDMESRQSSTRNAAPRVLTIVWLTVTTMMAISGLIMAAWATSKLWSAPSVVLVSNPQQAYKRGWTPIGNLYAGSGYWSKNALDMEEPRSDHGAVSYRGAIYVFGGTSYNVSNNFTQIVLTNMTRYNMYNGTFKVLDPMPEPR